ncbi:phosphotransferase-like protein [Streptomyces litchfieldiae]|uniref:Guanylate kinase n=1 Tax=Streptomyces litchfieldiae TaxID=3075543 RepID=A0ABU2N0X5_9ACTN|nr:guanylate kinase [Streptomyces sp. DSM 44938]MDT0347555.1 guanylate kinase [Streptomyces sp. DSM 44938]
MIERQGVVLYGPPAAGKDTVTAALGELGCSYVPFARLKAGPGRTAGYRMSSAERLAALEAAGDVIYANRRYNAVYVIDRPGLDEACAAGVPVVHLGQVAGVRALVAGYPAAWLSVLLWCPREVTAARSTARGDVDTDARLAAWDATEQDLERDPFAWDLRVETTVTEPADAARRIDQLLKERAGAASA